MSYYWFLLFFAGIFEIFMGVGLKMSEGFTRFWPIIATILFGSISFYALSQAIRKLPIGTSYAVWTGIGSVGIAIVGVIIFKEHISLVKIIMCISFIIFGVLGLKVL